MSEAPRPELRVGTVAVVGRPNVGKSTLLNRLVGQKVSITSRRPQTTRHPILGIVTRDDAQFVFVDTPGFQKTHGGPLNRALNRSVTDTLRDIDVFLFVIEALRFGPDDARVLSLLPAEQPVVVAVNKVDRVDRRERLLPFLADLSTRRDFAAIVPVSAQKGTQCDDLERALRPWLPPADALRYDADQVTDRSERFLAAEFVREKLFRTMGDELPYEAAVVIEQFEMEGELRRIHAAIVVGRDSHKAMVIGAGGERLKQIATDARIDMEREFQGRVWLELWVKVDEHWARDPRRIAAYGFA
ncbi:MAG: GTPase Era [Burkholderiales bacterium]|jgi:GTP-binding protein Era|nr:GTPase Era [Burkholderiales bacterium]